MLTSSWSLRSKRELGDVSRVRAGASSERDKIRHPIHRDLPRKRQGGDGWHSGCCRVGSIWQSEIERGMGKVR